MPMNHKNVRVTVDLVVPVDATAADVTVLIEGRLSKDSWHQRCKVASVQEDVSTPVWELADEKGCES